MVKIATILMAVVGILGLLGVHAPAIASMPSLAHGHDMTPEPLGTFVAASFESASGLVEETQDTCPTENDHHSGHSGCCGPLASCFSGCGAAILAGDVPIFSASKASTETEAQWRSTGLDVALADPPPRSL